MAEETGSKGELRDSHGRVIDYLRVSVTDRCNLRCVYCMGEEGVEWKPHGDILSFEELIRCCRVMAEEGIRKVKVTGGEALVRRGTTAFIAGLKALPGIAQVTLTTNGLLLEGELGKLADAGLDGVNISLDTLDGESFRRITRRDGLDKTLSAIDAACAVGLKVKVNCVLLRGWNDHELAALAALAKHRPAAVRFIELMPLGIAGAFEPVSGKEAAEALEKAFGKLVPLAEEGPGKVEPGNGPAVYYALEGFTGNIGFINPLSEAFCKTCNRLRLSSQGLLQPCLAGDISLDLRALLRSGADDGALKQALHEAAALKPEGHHFSALCSRNREGNRRREMFRIGG